MIKPILRGIRTAAALPVYILGNALMVTILERRLRRETAKVQSLTVERDEVQRKLNLANGAVHQQIEVLRSRDAEVESAENEWAAAAIERDGAEERAKEAEGQLEALRSAAREALAIATGAQWTKYHRPSDVTIEAILSAALKADGTPPVQDTPPTKPLYPGGPCVACGEPVNLTVPLTEGWLAWHGRCPTARPPVEGDHPANDPVTQQWAGIVEGLTKQRDEDTRRLEAAWRERDMLKREVDRLRKEQGDTDRDHDAAVAELKARHREVLAERDQAASFLRADLAEKTRETCAALGLDLDGYTWPTLLSLMRSIAQRARSATNRS